MASTSQQVLKIVKSGYVLHFISSKLPVLQGGRFVGEEANKQIWDIKARRIRSLLQGHMQEIYSLDFSRDGRFLVSGSGDKSARVWDIEKGTCVFDLRIEDFLHNEHGPIDAGITSVARKSSLIQSRPARQSRTCDKRKERSDGG
jgi:WD40 repeat protein